MAIQLISGASSDILTIDPASKAARVTLYGPDGEPRAFISNRDRGIADVRVQQSATTGAPAVVWAIRSVTTARVVYVSKLWLQLYQSGTGAATELWYELIKGTGCTGISNGSTVTPLRKRTLLVNPDVEVKVLDTGLTLTGVTLGSAFFNCLWPRITHSATATANSASNPFVLDFGDEPIELALNEVLAIRTVNTAVVGDGIIGGCEFHGG
jgi:hypothetical protein